MHQYSHEGLGKAARLHCNRPRRGGAVSSSMCTSLAAAQPQPGAHLHVLQVVGQPRVGAAHQLGHQLARPPPLLLPLDLPLLLLLLLLLLLVPGCQPQQQPHDWCQHCRLADLRQQRWPAQQPTQPTRRRRLPAVACPPGGSWGS
jgi:hypothetical protein